MSGRRVFAGVTPYMGKADLAAALNVPEDMIDTLVRTGKIPKPALWGGNCIRWRWADVDAALASLGPSSKDTASDPYREGARNATKKAESSREPA